jgi:hypothetical protein
MGDLTSAGSGAVVFVDNFLSQTGRETFKGKSYTLQRNEIGDIEIRRSGSPMLIVALLYWVVRVQVKPMA